MKNITFLRLASIVLLSWWLLSSERTEAAIESSIPFQEINRSFPDSIHIQGNGQRTIEFCPDNTCDAFVASKGVTQESLLDFAYVYIYYFSDYYVLKDWRVREESRSIAKQILSKPHFMACNNKGAEKETARCVLHLLSQKNRVKLYAIRYDENIRHAKRISIP